MGKLLYLLSFVVLFNCCNNKANSKNEETHSIKSYLELKEPLFIEKDFSIHYLKIGLKYSEFLKINKTKFKEHRTGGLSCGDITLWSSSIELNNETLKLSIEFSNSWEDNTEKEEETLSKIQLKKKGSEFYNGIILGKSNIYEVKNKFGQPKREEVDFLEYIFDNRRTQLFFNNSILEFIIIR